MAAVLGVDSEEAGAMGPPVATPLPTGPGLAGCEGAAKGSYSSGAEMTLCVRTRGKRCTYREKWSLCFWSLEESHTATYVLDLTELGHGLS